MKKLDCVTAERLIITDLDEGLDPSAKTLLEEHLRACPECRTIEQETASIVGLVASDVPHEPDDQFWKYYDISLDARLQDAKPRSAWNWWWKIAAAAAVAVAAFAVIHLSTLEVPLPTSISDTRIAPGLAQVFEQVYGPVEDETTTYALVEADRNALAALTGFHAEEEVVPWFEVEDENSLFL